MVVAVRPELKPVVEDAGASVEIVAEETEGLEGGRIDEVDVLIVLRAMDGFFGMLKIDAAVLDVEAEDAGGGLGSREELATGVGPVGAFDFTDNLGSDNSSEEEQRSMTSGSGFRGRPFGREGTFAAAAALTLALAFSFNTHSGSLSIRCSRSFTSFLVHSLHLFK